MPNRVKVAILDSQQSIIDGYTYRLGKIPGISVVATATTGKEFSGLLREPNINVLLMEVFVPTAPDDPEPYPVFEVVNSLRQKHPTVGVLVVSMHNEYPLIRKAMESGARGYVLKDDPNSIRDLAAIVLLTARGGIYFSSAAYEKLIQGSARDVKPKLTQRQLEVLTLCASHPSYPLTQLARRLGVEYSTARNLLSSVYARLEVHDRTNAVLEANRLGLVNGAKMERSA